VKCTRHYQKTGAWLPPGLPRLVGVLNSLVRGMPGAHFGVSAEAAVHCDAEQLREAIDTWQAIVAIELSRISPQ